GAIRLWDVAKGTERIAAGDAAAPVSVAFVEGGRRLAVGSADGTVRHCDPLTGKVQHRCEAQEGKGAAVVFAPGCRVAAVAAEDGPVVVRDVLKGKELYRIKEAEGSSLTFSPDGRLLLMASDDGEERMMMRGRVVFKGGGRVVQGDETGGKTRLLDAATGKELRSLGAAGGSGL